MVSSFIVITIAVCIVLHLYNKKADETNIKSDAAINYVKIENKETKNNG